MSEDGQRENWGSRAGFVLAAIGSAVGLGNLWGFPYKVYDNGGGAFLIPYVGAMLLIGIPLLILEFSLGHMTQRAAPDAFRGINRKSEPVGWWGILLGFVIITYYPVILAYCASFLLQCFNGIWSNGGELPWKGGEIGDAAKFFTEDYLHEWSKEELASGVKPWQLGQLVWPIVGSLTVVWALMYLCIFKGVKLVSKVVLWTVPLPWIMLCILTVRGLTLPGAAEGLNFYLDPDWSRLAEPATWRWAMGQMFFSMSLAFGVMVTYASFLHRKSDINNNAAIIGIADVATSFVAGVAVFATLGAMTFAMRGAGHDIAVQEVAKGGPGLAFVVFPYALAQLDYSAWFGAVFFIALLTLGIDSAFSITESVLASLVDKTGWNRSTTLIGMSLVGLGFGIVYCTRGGLAWLGAIDSFVNDPWGGIALLGLLEAAVIGWGYRLKRLRDHANERSDWQLGAWWDGIIRYLAPLVLSALFSWSVLEKAASPGGFLYDGKGVFQTPSLVAMIVALAAPLLAIILSSIHSPGANRHAAHVGQEREARDFGSYGTVLLLVALVAACISFSLAIDDRQSANGILSKKDDFTTFGGFLRPSVWAALASAFLGLVAVFFGASTVHRAECSERRPSGLARLAAGGGIMIIGGAGGLLLAAAVLVVKVQNAAAKAAGTAVAQGARELPRDHLTGPAYFVLAAMAALMVTGLGWCFYRALKASGDKQMEVQTAEGTE